ncbi:MAG: winged helix-turn-helix transcriptional regulator [Saprospiraceae bacterium]|nr:winged helix-turn-helix transcriptional regulator [Candidatus Brachybacter algidus]
MGATRSDIFTDSQNETASMLKVLGHPARIAILEYLLKVDGCICNDIVDEINLAQPTISLHLKELKGAGIIKGNIEGKTICYCIEENALQKIASYFDNAIEKIKSKDSSCC